jgi:uroporphyrinogen-III synthase
MTNQSASNAVAAGRSLRGALVCLTRPSGTNESLDRLAKSSGAKTVEMPLIEIQPLPSESLAVLLKQFADYDGVVVTSANAVKAACDFAVSHGIDLGQATPWYAIGARTGRVIEDRQLTPVCLDAATAEDFAVKLAAKLGSKPQRLLFLHGVKARTVVPKALRHEGHQVDAAACYDTVDSPIPADAWRKMARAKTVFMPLFSPSAAKSLVRQWPASLAAPIHVIAIGATTMIACAGLGLRVAATAERPTAASVMEAITRLA